MPLHWAAKEDALGKGLQQFESFCILVTEAVWTTATVATWPDTNGANCRQFYIYICIHIYNNFGYK